MIIPTDQRVTEGRIAECLGCNWTGPLMFKGFTAIKLTDDVVRLIAPCSRCGGPLKHLSIDDMELNGVAFKK